MQVEKVAVTAYLRQVLHPVPDVLGPLATLARRYGLAAVSSSADARIAACFEVTGMAEHFPPARRFSAEDSLPVPTSKPDPAIYAYALHALGLEPEQALAVEDSVTGATSAVTAGIPTVGNLQFVQPAEREERRRLLLDAGVVALVDRWADVVDLLGQALAGALDVLPVGGVRRVGDVVAGLVPTGLPVAWRTCQTPSSEVPHDPR